MRLDHNSTLIYLDKLHSIAKARGGTCLATKYINNRERYPFRCGRGHEWNPTAMVIFNGHWCHICEVEDRRKPVEIRKSLRKLSKAKWRSNNQDKIVSANMGLGSFRDSLELLAKASFYLKESNG